MVAKYSQIAVLFGLLVFVFFSFYIVKSQSETTTIQSCTTTEVLTLTAEGLKCVSVADVVSESEDTPVSITSTCNQGQYISSITNNVIQCASFPNCQTDESLTSAAGIFSCTTLTSATTPPICTGSNKALQYSIGSLDVWTKKLKISENGGTGSTLCNEGGTGSKCLNIDLDARDRFSYSVSLNGNTLAVGAYGDDDGEASAGAVYLFEKENGSWTKKLKISNNDGGNGEFTVDLDAVDYFGISVSLNGTTLAVGAWGDDDGESNAGAVYLFEKENGNWTKKLKISENGGTGSTLCNKGGAGSKCLSIDLDDRDYFGSSVSLNGTTLAVGAYGDGDGGPSQGAVYIFKKNGNSWTKKLKISDNDGTGSTLCNEGGTGSKCLDIDLDADDSFGRSVSLNGTTLAVGAFGDDDGGIYAGAVYLFSGSSSDNEEFSCVTVTPPAPEVVKPPSCTGSNKFLQYDGSTFSCVTIATSSATPPSCTGSNKFLQYDGSTFSCVTIATPSATPPNCTGTSKALQYNGSRFSCVTTTANTPTPPSCTGIGKFLQYSSTSKFKCVTVTCKK